MNAGAVDSGKLSATLPWTGPRGRSLGPQLAQLARLR
jgi:hypothetical protein